MRILFAFGLLLCAANANAQSCSEPIECYERALSAIKGQQEALERARTDMLRTTALLKNSLLLSEKPCRTLGIGWKPWELANGKYMRVSSATSVAGDSGGEENIVIQPNNLPSHTHTYNDIYHTEDPNFERMPQVKNIYSGKFEAGGLGSKGTDYDNNYGGAQITRTTLLDDRKPKPIEIQPEFMSFNICHFE